MNTCSKAHDLPSLSYAERMSTVGTDQEQATISDLFPPFCKAGQEQRQQAQQNQVTHVTFHITRWQGTCCQHLRMTQSWAEGQGHGAVTSCFNRDLQTSSRGSSYPFKLLWTFKQSAWYSRAFFPPIQQVNNSSQSLLGIRAGSRFLSSFLLEGPFMAMWCWGRERLQIYSIHSRVPGVLPVQCTASNQSTPDNYQH